jgi:hypothetical protein
MQQKLIINFVLQSKGKEMAYIKKLYQKHVQLSIKTIANWFGSYRDHVSVKFSLALIYHLNTFCYETK